MGLIWKLCEPDHLLPEAMRHAEILCGQTDSEPDRGQKSMAEPTRPGIAAACAREDAYFAEMMGAAANAEALAEFERGRS